MEKDLYDILGLPKDCTKRQIKVAYHRFARQYHPDKNPDGMEKMKIINYAYEILSNEKMRSAYDKDGISGLHKADYTPTFGERLEKLCTLLIGFYALGLVTFACYAASDIILLIVSDLYLFIRYPSVELEWASPVLY